MAQLSFHNNHNRSRELQDIVVQLFIKSQALIFGEFQTKSGRNTPYFINTSRLYYGDHWSALMDLFTEKIFQEYGPKIEGVFGPSYKGIPLAVSFAERWYHKTQKRIPFAFSRKEPKDHGEKGATVGSLQDVSGSAILLCDDVLTSGLSLGESILFLRKQNVSLIGAMVTVDRQEQYIYDHGQDPQKKVSANTGIFQEFGCRVPSLVSVTDIIKYLEATSEPNLRLHIHKIQDYQRKYGVPDKTN
ncbi:MAG: orotate phosphoribosyltransferase [Proteobacteria bacterium]|nr:orotate phosphoribosyltransferase [Pseudomonadota bacterium]